MTFPLHFLGALLNTVLFKFCNNYGAIFIGAQSFGFLQQNVDQQKQETQAGLFNDNARMRLILYLLMTFSFHFLLHQH